MKSFVKNSVQMLHITLVKGDQPVYYFHFKRRISIKSVFSGSIIFSVMLPILSQ